MRPPHVSIPHSTPQGKEKKGSSSTACLLVLRIIRRSPWLRNVPLAGGHFYHDASSSRNLGENITNDRHWKSAVRSPRPYVYPKWNDTETINMAPAEG